MGLGHGRELAHAEDVDATLNEELSRRLDAALDRLDRMDPKFKAARDEERFAQSSKQWHRICGELDQHLRAIAKVLIRTHQLNLDIGCEGGGPKAMPWMEEMGQVIERLTFRLENGEAVAEVGRQRLTSAKLRDVSYAFVEQAVAEWVVASVERKR